SEIQRNDARRVRCHLHARWMHRAVHARGEPSDVIVRSALKSGKFNALGGWRHAAEEILSGAEAGRQVEAVHHPGIAVMYPADSDVVVPIPAPPVHAAPHPGW